MKTQDEVQHSEIIPPMKPLKPINEEKLPTVYLLTLVRSTERADRYHAVVGVEMRGDEVLKRRVLHTSESMAEAFDEFCRLGERWFYFSEGKQDLAGEGA